MSNQQRQLAAILWSPQELSFLKVYKSAKRSNSKRFVISIMYHINSPIDVLILIKVYSQNALSFILIYICQL